MIENDLKTIAGILMPNHVHIGTTTEGELILYWMNCRYTMTTKTLVYDKINKAFEYEGLTIRKVIEL